MRKYTGGAVVVAAMLLSACGTQQVDMSFEDAYEQFVSQQFVAVDSDMIMQTMDGNWISEGVIAINTKHDELDLTITSTMETQGVATTDGSMTIDLETQLDGQEMDASLSIDMYQSYQDASPVQFIKINNITMEGGDNPAAPMIQMIGQGLQGQWIEMDGQDVSAEIENPLTQTKKLMNNMFAVMNNLPSYKLLENKGQTVYQKHTAYRVLLQNDVVISMIDDVLADTSFAGSIDTQLLRSAVIEGYMVVQSHDDVELHITSIDGNENLDIVVTSDGIALYTRPETETDPLVTVSITGEGDDYRVRFVMEGEHVDPLVSVDMVVGYDAQEGQVINQYDGTIRITSPALEQAIQKETISFLVDGQSTSKKVDDKDLTPPSDAVPLTELMQGMGLAPSQDIQE